MDAAASYATLAHVKRDHISIDQMEIIQIPKFGKSAQPSETFFERKFGVNPMGVFDEARGTGVTYLFSQNNGKTNSNHVTSVLKYHIEMLKLLSDYRELLINLDNCRVNKNDIVIAFAIMLVMSNVYDLVELHFLIAGHTKFSPDRMFGWISLLLKSKDIFGIDDILRAFADDLRLKGASAQKSYALQSLEGFTGNKANNFYDYKTLLEDLIGTIKDLNSYHRFRARRVKATVVLEVIQYSTDNEWKLLQTLKIKKFISPENISKVPMKAAKLADLEKQERFIPTGKFTFLEQ